MSKRLLVTGSRGWTNWTILHRELRRAWFDLIVNERRLDVVLVSGACPTGADRMAEDIWLQAGLPVERHPAQWSRPNGSKDRHAGTRRNQQMVDLGADLCLAFVTPCQSPYCRRTDKHDSHGTTHCVTAARAAGIPTHIYREEA